SDIGRSPGWYKPGACKAAPFRATSAIASRRASVSRSDRSWRMRVNRAAVCAFWLARKSAHCAGGCSQRSTPASRGETPCIAATARASRHSDSDHEGVAEPGLASSAAKVSVILRSASWTDRKEGTEVLIQGVGAWPRGGGSMEGDKRHPPRLIQSPGRTSSRRY